MIFSLKYPYRKNKRLHNGKKLLLCIALNKGDVLGCDSYKKYRVNPYTRFEMVCIN